MSIRFTPELCLRRQSWRRVKRAQRDDMVAADQITKREERDSGEREGLVAIKKMRGMRRRGGGGGGVGCLWSPTLSSF